MIKLLQVGLAITLMVSPIFLSAQVKITKSKALEIQADTLMGREDFEGALPLYNQAIKKSKPTTQDDYKIFYKRAFCYYALGNFESALTDVNTYLNRYSDEQARLLRAYIHQELGNYKEQLSDIDFFVEANPANPDLLRWRLTVLMQSENYREAQRDIRQLLNYQFDPELQLYLGLSYYYLNELDSAIIVFDETIERAPDFIQTYLYAGSICLEESAYAMALHYLDKGLQVDRQNATLLFYKGVALIEEENSEYVDEACRCFTKAFNFGFDDAADYLKEFCYGVE